MFYPNATIVLSILPGSVHVDSCSCLHLRFSSSVFASFPIISFRLCDGGSCNNFSARWIDVSLAPKSLIGHDAEAFSLISSCTVSLIGRDAESFSLMLSCTVSIVSSNTVNFALGSS